MATSRFVALGACFLALAATALTGACGDDTELSPDGGGGLDSGGDSASVPEGGGDGGASSPVVNTTAGPVRGSATATMQSWKGIPYAAPPVGPLRFAAPNAPASFTAVRDATAFGPHCAQSVSPFGTTSNSEDCLYLNVYAPTTAGPHPVMFWMHGGALVVGEGDEYDASRFVAQGIVVVTINYRLGMLGFLSHPALTAEQSGSSGNYGFMDQQFALHWVQDNIAAFGGDKTNVTIFGESAGGLSVHAQLVATGAAGLYGKAVIESGAYANAVLPALATAEVSGTALATTAGCVAPCTTAALRALPLASILTAQATVSSWIPAIDGKFLTTGISDALTNGNYQKVPVIEGSNHDEYRLFVGLAEATTKTPLTDVTYPIAVQAAFPTLLPATVAALTTTVYPPSAYGGSASLAFGALGTDLLFACNSRSAGASLAAAAPSVATYVYEFADENAPENFLPAVSFPYGAAHASELQYLWKLPLSTLSADQESLATTMASYWGNFAKTGDPNGAGAPTWPAYTGAADGILSLAPGAGNVKVTTDFKTDHKCM